MMLARLLAPVCLVAFAPFVGAQPANLVADVDALIKRSGFSEDGPGLGVLVLQKDRPLLSRTHGLARLRDRVPLTTRTTFELASVTKTFTATAILMLHERGKVALTDDIRKYVPELPGYRHGRPILLTDLLQHTSGLPDYMQFTNVPSKDPKFLSNEDHAGEFARQQEKFSASFAPGDRYEYNNTNYMLLALVLERVTKKSFGTFLKDEIFRPLGMNDSWVYERPGITPKDPKLGYLSAIGYTRPRKGGYEEGWSSPPFRDERLLTTGDGGVWTNLEDMARWDAGLRAGKLIKRETLQAALKPSRTRDGKTNKYGHGWSLTLEKGQVQAFGHEGSWAGFRTVYYHDPSLNRTIVVLSNRGDFNPERFRSNLVSLLDRQR